MQDSNQVAEQCQHGRRYERERKAMLVTDCREYWEHAGSSGSLPWPFLVDINAVVHLAGVWSKNAACLTMQWVGQEVRTQPHIGVQEG